MKVHQFFKFQCISPEGAHVTYKCSGVYNPKTEFGINPFDADIAVDWPIKNPSQVIVSERDQQHADLKDLNLQVVQQI